MSNDMIGKVAVPQGLKKNVLVAASALGKAVADSARTVDTMSTMGVTVAERAKAYALAVAQDLGNLPALDTAWPDSLTTGKGKDAVKRPLIGACRYYDAFLAACGEDYKLSSAEQRYRSLRLHVKAAVTNAAIYAAADKELNYDELSTYVVKPINDGTPGACILTKDDVKKAKKAKADKASAAKATPEVMMKAALAALRATYGAQAEGMEKLWAETAPRLVRVDAPKTETPKTETPKAETPKAETPAPAPAPDMAQILNQVDLSGLLQNLAAAFLTAKK